MSESCLHVNIYLTFLFSFRLGSSESVAFSAALSGVKTPIGPKQTIIYDRVLTNVGHCFDEYTGVFKACIAGTYVFSVSAKSQSSHYIWLDIVHNGNVLCRAMSYQTSYYTQGECMAVVALRRGDDVWIRHFQGDTLTGSYYNVFSGFLISS